ETQEPQIDAEAAYERLPRKQKKLVESLAKKLTPERIEELRAAALLPGVLDLLDLKLEKELSVKDLEFYRKLPEVVTWRMDVIKERRDAEQRINEQAGSLSLRMEAGKAAAVVEVPLEINQLVDEAARLEIELPIKVLLADAAEVGSEQIGEISVTLDKNWGVGRSSFEYKLFAQRTVDKLAGAESLNGDKFGNGYSLAKDENGKIRLIKGDKLVAEVSAQEGGQIVLNWSKDTAVDQGLMAMAVLGQGFNDLFAKGEKFPSMFLELVEPATEEPTGTVLEGQEAPKPLEETSAAKQDLSLPDWLRAIQEDDDQATGLVKPGVKAESVSVATEENEPDLYEIFGDQRPGEPEAPKPVAVISARKPIETVAQAIRERGGADFEFDQTSAHNLFYATLDNIIKGIYVPGLAINHFGISEFNISGGQIRLTVNAGGSFKKIISVPVSASMSFRLSSSLDLLGEPSINLPTLAPKNAKGIMINQLRQIKAELSRTIISDLSANKITDASVENVGVVNSSFLATIRGKVSR
ncbi:MAG: hypothetical protein U1C50_01085, partial [Patescibacteria group bacterium]|nr:hypothetical protein [Patescibacteria group bacterium]